MQHTSYQRFSSKNIKEALADTPVIFIMGPRQSGKTTLVKSLINKDWHYGADQSSVRR
jgi:predicted AAA+ superfamily ATPase